MAGHVVDLQANGTAVRGELDEERKGRVDGHAILVKAHGCS